MGRGERRLRVRPSRLPDGPGRQVREGTGEEGEAEGEAAVPGRSGGSGGDAGVPAGARGWAGAAPAPA